MICSFTGVYVKETGLKYMTVCLNAKWLTHASWGYGVGRLELIYWSVLEPRSLIAQSIADETGG